MIDPLVSLAFNVHQNKGIFALLIGSGVSRSAGIPTGWEVTTNLIQRVAAGYGEDPEPDPAAWFHEKFGKGPNYSDLLEQLGRTKAECRSILASYFEPTEEEREQGMKVPTAAHDAVADLVPGRYIRIILTTNFDRLLEEALEAKGVTTTVLSTPDLIEGSLPIQHYDSVIIKLHGDYLDPRIKNTATELARYEGPVEELLDRVLDEYGLIVCGWSGDWDQALRAAMERCKNRRFQTYWTTRSEPTKIAERLITHRRAQLIYIQDADLFFSGLTEKVVSIEEYSEPHPASAQMVSSLVKRYIAEDRYRIRLHDLVMNETRKARDSLELDHSEKWDTPTPELMLEQVYRDQGVIESMMHVMSTGCYWGDQDHAKLWSNGLRSLAEVSEPKGSYVAWSHLSKFPALVVLYTGTISALAADNWDILARLLTHTHAATIEGRRPVITVANIGYVFEDKLRHMIPEYARHYTPESDFLHEMLKPVLRETNLFDHGYDETFDLAEYLMGLVRADISNQERPGDFCAPVGQFGRKLRHRRSLPLIESFLNEVNQEGESSPILLAGFFAGSFQRFQEAQEGYNEFVSKVSRRWL